MRLILIVNVVGKILAILAVRTSWPLALVLWFLPELAFWYHLLVPRAQGFVRMHRRFVTSRPEIWLTIDDGPDPADTPRILALLAQHEARATFFVIGERAARHPELVRAMLAAGHEVAHHTQTHPLGTFWFASRQRLNRELDEALAVLGGLGARATRFRPPAGLKNIWLAAALKKRGLTCIGWSARGLELMPGGPERVASRATRNLGAGAILLMHEGPRVPGAIRVEGIRQVLERVKGKGFRCVVPTAEQLAER